jgi:hypothetical protein
MSLKSQRKWGKPSINKNKRDRFPNRNLESNISMDLGDNQSKIDDKFMEIDGQNNFSNLSISIKEVKQFSHGEICEN